jgi:hypothetical protein
MVMVQSTIGRALTDIERAIEAEVRNMAPAHEALTSEGAPAMAMPDYVEHREGATEIGKLSAEAVVREYESAAKEIEATGADLMDLVRQCETMTRNALAVTEQLKETAGRYREEARRVFLEIENCSEVTAEVRKTCTELREKIAGPGATGTKAKRR